MADFSQAAVADAMAHVQTTNPASVFGSSITPTAGALWAVIHLHHAFWEEGDHAVPSSFYVQTNLGTTNESWTTVAQFTTTDEANVTSEQMDATEASGEVELAVTLTAGFAADDYIYVWDASVAANSEWHQIDLIATDATVTLISGLVTGKDSADFIFSHAETFTMTLDLSGVARWRVIYKNEGSGAGNTAIWVRYIEVTDIE